MGLAHRSADRNRLSDTDFTERMVGSEYLDFWRASFNPDATDVVGIVIRDAHSAKRFHQVSYGLVFVIDSGAGNFSWWRNRGPVSPARRDSRHVELEWNSTISGRH
jgi:hypothetical protein